MGDMGDVFNEWGKAKQARRAKNMVESTALLDKHGIAYQSYNGGVHLKLRHVCGPIDYWPSTGLWMVHFNKGKRRGIKSLLAYFGIYKI